MREMVRRAGLAEEIAVASRACRTDEIGSDMHEGSRRVLRAHGIPFTRRAARLVRREDYAAYDLILAMDAENLRDLRRLFEGDPAGKCRLLLSFAGEAREVADPWYTGDFERTYQDIKKGCTGLLTFLQTRQKSEEEKP